MNRSTISQGLVLALFFCTYALPMLAQQPSSTRARDLGIPLDGTPGPLNAITDVAGIRVGHATVIEGEGAQAARTGVTAILPNRTIKPVFGATHMHNGDGEMTGTFFINEKGYLISPVLITNTISVGTVHSAVVRWSLQTEGLDHVVNLPVVAETWDGDLNDIYGFHVKEEHVFQALTTASEGPVAEGNVGGGMGMICHWFKGGIGTASRVLPESAGAFTIGVLVQANHGDRQDFRIAGIPVGREIEGFYPELEVPLEGDGSIIVVVATDAPLLPHQLKRVLRRVAMGLARNGSFSSSYSGDLFLAFSTADYDGTTSKIDIGTRYLHDAHIDAVFRATVQAVEEAVLNAMVAAKTLVGVNGNRVHALPHDQVRTILQRHNRLLVR